MVSKIRSRIHRGAGSLCVPSCHVTLGSIGGIDTGMGTTDRSCVAHNALATPTLCISTRSLLANRIVMMSHCSPVSTPGSKGEVPILAKQIFAEGMMAFFLRQ